MKLKNMFKKTSYISLKETSGHTQKPEVPEGLLKKCNHCKSAIITEDVVNGFYICPKCQNYFRIPAFQRIEMVTDQNSFEEWDTGLFSKNPLHYKGYEEKLAHLKEKTGLDEAVITGKATIHGIETAIGVCDSRFIMASMGEVFGEKITRLVERATWEKLPIVLFICSGGARMQEGITSLMQMAKTAAAFKKYSDAGGFYLPVLTNPTTGGVTASFAMLGDIILAEPKALIGFAGPRVIEQTIGQKLPEGFQTSEFLLEHGFIDHIVERETLKETLFHLLKMHTPPFTCSKPSNPSLLQTKETLPISKTAWEHVEKSRSKSRPVGSQYIASLFTNFVELHGDRSFGDDKAILGGIAEFHGIPVTVITQEKGTTTKENIARNFGMPSPEGYRKALRLMKQAEKFQRPVICFVDTPGAFCGLEAEERGQGEAIARNIYEMSSLKVPILSIIIGEGGSGGALALATSDEVWMLENSIYSILSPEGFASILWKDSKRAKEAAELMQLTALDLYQKNIIEKIICEPPHFSAETLSSVCDRLDSEILEFIQQYQTFTSDELIAKRYDRFRKM